MPNLTIMTFNVENLLARFEFGKWEHKSLTPFIEVDSEIDRANLIAAHWQVVENENRVFTALNMKEKSPEVICVQEVENMAILKGFHQRYLKRISGKDYRHLMLIDGNDSRLIDVAVLSRCRIVSAMSHQDMEATINYADGPKKERVFRRDCLEVNIKKSNQILPIFVCHFKSMCGGRRETKPIREAEAAAVKKIVEERFDDPSQSDWIIVGDLNDYNEDDTGQPDNDHGLGPLLNDGFVVDLVKRIENPRNRWTHYWPTGDEYRQLDYILLSPALAAKNRDVVPTIVRNGQPYRAGRYSGKRWPRVGYDEPKASDHCPVVVTLRF
jgi:endonuclease/exonuclease/phosphatase family metal-dependent hydrolase